MGVDRRSRLARELTPRFPVGRTYVPHVPHPPQQAFLLLSFVAEVFYGGAAGGGKSDAGLMSSLQYADVPGYSALIIRRSFADLALPGAIMSRAAEWLGGTEAVKKDGGKLWTFPTADPNRPATLQFGYAQTHQDIHRYQGAEFQSVFVDELTHFEERTYRYLFSRLRGPAVPCFHCGHQTSQPAGERRGHDEDHDWCVCGHEHQPWVLCPEVELGGCDCAEYEPAGCPCVTAEPDREATNELGALILPAAEDGTTLADVPLRMRSGSNPGGVGHEWVKKRFVTPETRRSSAVFVPAKLRDNPSVDRRAYRASLGHLDPVEAARLEDGDWDIADEGDVFQRSWFEIVDEAPGDCRWLLYWDLAATVEKPAKRKKGDPDWTVGSLLGLSPQGQWFLREVRRFRKDPLGVETEVALWARELGRGVPIRMEQEPGSSGVAMIDHYRRGPLLGFDFDGHRPTLSKEERAAPMARAAKAGNFKLVSGAWNSVWLDEVAGFPNLPHDDQVDSADGAMDRMLNAHRARIIA